MKDDSQQVLFDKGNWWDEHWQGMPEFVQEDLTPFKSIYVHFENREGMEKFAKLTGQKIQTTTQSIWYPEAEIGKTAGKAYTTNGYKNES